VDKLIIKVTMIGQFQRLLCVLISRINVKRKPPNLVLNHISELSNATSCKYTTLEASCPTSSNMREEINPKKIFIIKENAKKFMS
jgi:hypothetical protein